MRIKKLELKNFKRFTDLTIDSIPDTAKLVLLIGSNGSGKSSVFDAFDWLGKGYGGKGNPVNMSDYYSKNQQTDPSVKIEFIDLNIIQKVGNAINDTHQRELARRFIGRSSIRIVPRIINQYNTEQVPKDLDSPTFYIENDTRFLNDISLYIQQIDNALREPVFKGKQADTLKIFRDSIEPLNTSLLKIFGGDVTTTIQIIEYENATPSSPAKLIFQKGESKINYELLSHGEKQVVILLINFIVRQEYYNDAIIFIDEMDCHLNTALQYSLIDEIVTRWIPENSQLWTASHALGFIEFANNHENAAIFDFDNFNFDSRKVLVPEPKNNPDLFDIAVSKEFLAYLSQMLDVYFVENKDKEFYGSIGIPNIAFSSANDRYNVYHKVKATDFKGIVDRDFLSDDDIIQIKANYPNLRILNYYSIENYMYHPDNLHEYYLSKNQNFDKDQYILLLTAAKNEEKSAFRQSISMYRCGYPYFGEPNFNGNLLQNRFKNSGENTAQSNIIGTYLDSDDLETFYKVLPMKDYCKQLPQRQNIPKTDLVKTAWFKTKITEVLNG